MQSCQKTCAHSQQKFNNICILGLRSRGGVIAPCPCWFGGDVDHRPDLDHRDAFCAFQHDRVRQTRCRDYVIRYVSPSSSSSMPATAISQIIAHFTLSFQLPDDESICRSERGFTYCLRVFENRVGMATVVDLLSLGGPYYRHWWRFSWMIVIFGAAGRCLKTGPHFQKCQSEGSPALRIICKLIGRTLTVWGVSSIM